MNRSAEKYPTLIIDPHTLFREGLRALLSSNPKIKIVGEAGDGYEAIRLASKLKPNLILMELLLPKIHGLDVIKEVKNQSPETKVIAVTAVEEEYYILESLKADVNGYCLKDATYEELTLAIKRVLAERRYLSPRITDLLEKYIDGRKTLRLTEKWQSVSRREKQTLKLVGEGYPNKEIAKMLGIDINTVKRHRCNVIRKLDLHSFLIVEPNSISRGMLRKILLTQLDSMVCMEAADAEEALRKIQEQKPDLVFTAIKLPDRDGLLLTKEIKETHPDIVVVIFTNYGPEYRGMAKSSGADYFFSKDSTKKEELLEVAKSVSEAKFKS